MLVEKWNHIFLLCFSWTLHLLFSQPWKTALWLSLFFWPALPPYCTKCHTLPVYTWNNWTGREETSCVIVEPRVFLFFLCTMHIRIHLLNLYNYIMKKPF